MLQSSEFRFRLIQGYGFHDGQGFSYPATSLMMCENAPPEWQIVPEENIKRFQKSVRYKKSADKEAALEKFKITFQKQMDMGVAIPFVVDTPISAHSSIYKTRYCKRY